MIVGIVRGREAVIRLVLCADRRRYEVEAVVDSGYTGYLALPPAVVSALNLTWRTFDRATLADGSETTFDVYRAKVEWDGRVRSIYVDELDATPLIGMSLLKGFEFKMQVRARGPVTIRRLSRTMR